MDMEKGLFLPLPTIKRECILVAEYMEESKKIQQKSTRGRFEVLQCYTIDKKLNPKEMRQIQWLQ